MSKIKKLPSNIILLATHGSAEVPGALQKHLRPELGKRLRRNFSDFATKSLLQPFGGQVLVPLYGRIAGDPNRAKKSADFFRLTDFGGLALWKPNFLSALAQKKTKFNRRFAKLSRDRYFDQIFTRIETALADPKNRKNPLIILDFHDTGNLILGRNFQHDQLRAQLSDFVMPQVILSNCDGQTASPAFLQGLQKKFADFLNIKQAAVHLNDHFTGGHITQFFGGVVPNERLQMLLKKYGRQQSDLQVVQVELNRNLYLNEATQALLPRMGRVRRQIEQLVKSFS